MLLLVKYLFSLMNFTNSKEKPLSLCLILLLLKSQNKYDPINVDVEQNNPKNNK